MPPPMSMAFADQPVLATLPISIVRLDRSYRIIDANARFCQVVQCPLNQVQFQDCRLVCMAADVWGRWSEVIETCFQTQQPGHFEYLATYPDGREALVEFRYVPEIAPDGTAPTILVIAVVIDEVRQLRQALQSEEAKFAQFMDHMPGIAWMRDAESRYTYLNKCYRVRYGPQSAERIGRKPEEVWPPEIAAVFRGNDARVMRTNRSIQVFETAPDPDGTSRTWLNVKFPFENA
ncbi:MAG: PAS domain-containing protein, partial [Gemmataceae bacterium]